MQGLVSDRRVLPNADVHMESCMLRKAGKLRRVKIGADFCRSTSSKRRRVSCSARPSQGIQPDATSLIGDTPLVTCLFLLLLLFRLLLLLHLLHPHITHQTEIFLKPGGPF